MPSNTDKRILLATRVALSALWTPYRWGGDDPMAGFDCSGFVIEILKTVGILNRGYDNTARGLFLKFSEVDEPKEGCLVFWRGSGQRIIHVEYCLDSVYSIGASGGGGKTVNLDEAIKQNAYIKIRPFRSRANIAGFANPFI